ncbi:MAG TPA: hypothetical protein VJM11_17015, partial [Nevskiaceae bacterium]|nr:hypothetical protein [Nevskiaceae bacterium]
VPGTTMAMAEAQLQPGNVTNTSATISDVESITGAGLSFAVAEPLSGSFDGYTAGTPTTANVTWNSATQTDSGSITFTKTLTLDGPRVTSGTLSDTATLTASDAFTATSNTLDIGITSSASVELTVTKTIPDFMDIGQRLEVEFHVARTGDSTFSRDITLTFVGGGASSASTTLKGLVPDTYSVTEGTVTFYPADYPSSPSMHPALVPLQGNTQTKDLTVQDGSGDPYANCAGTVQFDNAVPTTAAATARVQKITDPALQQGDPDYFWTFSLYGPDGTLVDTLADVVGANEGFVAFALPLSSSGTWTVVETPRTNWDLDSATPNDGTETKICSFAVDLIFDEGKTFDCTFHNTKRGRAALIKTVVGGVPTGSESFTFQLRSGATLTDTGTILETKNANANNGGTFNFATTLVPGQTYQICEVVMPGWQTTLTSFVPGSFMPPDGVATNPNVDNSILCADFTVSAGETKTITVDNTPPPGGLAHTIGFWKNWASCTRSATKKMNTLDVTLASFPIAGGQTTHGVLVGTLYVDTCSEAVSLLNKSTLSGKKQASDAAFNMAAQLMAAQLNVQAGAGTCPAVTTAMIQGQALLVQYAFNGETHTTINAANRLLMNNIAETLDRYNNNVLCGP